MSFMSDITSHAVTASFMMHAPTVILAMLCITLTPFVLFFKFKRWMIANNDADCKKWLRGMERSSPYFTLTNYYTGGKDMPNGFIWSKSLQYFAYIKYSNAESGGGRGDNCITMIVWCTIPRKVKILELSEKDGDDADGDARMKGKEISENDDNAVFVITEFVLGPSMMCTYYIQTQKQFRGKMLRSPSRSSDQYRILHEMLNMYDDSLNHNLSCLVFGPPRTGKSMLAYLMAKELGGTICKFNPTTAGESIAELYNDASPTFKSPLVLLVDEYDTIIHNVYERQIRVASKTRTLVTDKSSHNTHMDDLRLYPNLLIIRTTNTPKSVLDNKYDTSYLREGRINAYFVCKTPVHPGESFHKDDE